MLTALAECEVVGVATNIAFLERLIKHEAFAAGQLDTGLIDKHRAALFPLPSPTPKRALLVAALAEYADIAQTAAARAAMSGDPHSPWHSIDAWWNASATYAIELMFAEGESRHAIDGAGLGRIHDVVAAAQVEHGNCIADAVHLHNRPIGERSQIRVPVPRTYRRNR